jgi:hypothetical protein
MNGATNTNPSDAPHILTAREEKQVKRSIAKETKVDENHVAQAGKALRSAENDEKKAEKVCLPIQVVRRHFFSVYIDAVEQATQKAQQSRDKAVKQEHRTAQALNDVQHKHDLAIADERKAARDLSVRIVTVVTAKPHLPSVNHLALCRWLVSYCRCVRSTFRKPIELLRVGVLNSSKLSVRRIQEM